MEQNAKTASRLAAYWEAAFTRDVPVLWTVRCRSHDGQDNELDTDFDAKADWAIAGATRVEPAFCSQCGDRTGSYCWAGPILLCWTRSHAVRGKVIPSRQVQVLQSLDGGIVSEILVKEGQVVVPAT